MACIFLTKYSLNTSTEKAIGMKISYCKKECKWMKIQGFGLKNKIVIFFKDNNLASSTKRCPYIQTWNEEEA